MIEIITAAGTILDLDKDQDIQVEMEQPLLDSDHLPVAYSTPISFPISDTNKTAFGYIPAMMLEPTVREVEASIFVFGRAIFTGTLVYDGVEDGKLRYIFTEKGLSEELEKDIAPEGIDAYTWEQMHSEGSKYRMPIIADKKFAGYYVDAFNRFRDSYPDGEDNVTRRDIKYRNCGYNLKNEEDYSQGVDQYDHSCSFLPVVRLRSLLEGLNVQWPTDSGAADKIHMLCPYGNALYEYDTFTQADITKDVYPDVLVKDILTNLCSMLCAAVYKQGNGYFFFYGRKIFERTLENILFWDKKISDLYSLSVEPRKNYSLSLGEEPVDGEDKSYESTANQNISGSDSYSLSHHRVKEGLTSEDKIYSIRTHRLNAGVAGEYAPYTPGVDIVYRNDGEAHHEVGAEETFENKSDFKLVHTVPGNYIAALNSSHVPIPYTFRAPLIEMPDKDDGRGKDMIVGLMGTDHELRPASLVEEDVDESYPHTINDSLLPGELYNLYHRAFAEWMGTDRTVVKADLLLNMDDLTQLALYKRVNFRGRDWMIKKLSLTFHTDSDRIETTGEFISL